MSTVEGMVGRDGFTCYGYVDPCEAAENAEECALRHACQAHVLREMDARVVCGGLNEESELEVLVLQDSRCFWYCFISSTWCLWVL